MAENSNLEFNSWDLLIKHLMAKLIRRREESGREAPNPERIKQIFQRASKDKVVEYMERVERELIPAREWKAAMSLLTTFLRNKVVVVDGDLHLRCVDLLEHCQTAKNKEEERSDFFDDVALIAKKYRLAIEYYTNEVILLNQMVRSAGQIIKPGSNY
jgi:hypothetical protein